MLELLRGPSYGYDLIRQIAALGFRRAAVEPGVVYKVLRSLEETGAIHSQWSTEGSGPARRYYEITDEGRAFLRRRAHQLKRYQANLERLLSAYTDLTGDDLSVSDDSSAPIGEPAGAR
ncbi:MAG: helix-turn-helix transcriptional regulator [Chloroflexi bacterium]|nr:helix-turn-helix transcriptional regulator [Chloroflexota bacterium]